PPRRRRRARRRRLRRRDRGPRRGRGPRRRPGARGAPDLHRGDGRPRSSRRSHHEMAGPADYTRAVSTVTREVIDVSTPENSSDDTATTGAAEARTAVRLDPDLAMAVLGAADTHPRNLQALLASDLHVRGRTMTITALP